MEVQMPERVDMRGLEGPHLAFLAALLGALHPRRGAHPAAAFAQPPRQQKPAHAGVGRGSTKVRINENPRGQIVGVQLHAPAGVRAVLGQQHGRQLFVHSRLAARIAAQLAPQYADRVVALAPCPVVPLMRCTA